MTLDVRRCETRRADRCSNTTADTNTATDTCVSTYVDALKPVIKVQV